MKAYEAVVKRITELCHTRNISIDQLAYRSGMAPSTLKNIIHGNSKNPGITTIQKLCNGLDISMPDFFNTEYFWNLDQEIE